MHRKKKGKVITKLFSIPTLKLISMCLSLTLHFLLKYFAMLFLFVLLIFCPSKKHNMYTKLDRCCTKRVKVILVEKEGNNAEHEDPPPPSFGDASGVYSAGGPQEKAALKPDSEF